MEVSHTVEDKTLKRGTGVIDAGLQVLGLEDGLYTAL